MITTRKYAAKSGLSPKQQNIGFRRKAFNIGSSSNSFEVLAIAGDPEAGAKGLNERGMSKQLVPMANKDRGEQGSSDFAKNLGVRRNNSKNNLGPELIGIQAHSTTTPTLHFSNTRVEQIINDTQKEMMMNSTLVKQPLVTLNTFIFDVPSQSVESFGEFEGESGQLMLSTGNKNDIVQANVRNMAIKSKLWVNQHEEDDEEDWLDGCAGYLSENDYQEVDQESACEDLEAKNEGAPAASPKSKLNIKAPVFYT